MSYDPSQRLVTDDTCRYAVTDSLRIQRQPAAAPTTPTRVSMVAEADAGSARYAFQAAPGIFASHKRNLLAQACLHRRSISIKQHNGAAQSCGKGYTEGLSLVEATPSSS